MYIYVNYVYGSVEETKQFQNLICFLHKVEAKKESERFIALRNKKLHDFRKRWEPLL